MNGRAGRMLVLLLIAAVAVGVAGIGLFSILKFLDLGDEIIYGVAFFAFFGMFFFAGQVIYPLLFLKKGVQSIRFQNGIAQNGRAAANTQSIASANRVGVNRAAVNGAATGSSVVIRGGVAAAKVDSFTPATVAVSATRVQGKNLIGRSGRRATGNLKVVPLQSTLTHEKVRILQGQKDSSLPADPRDELLAGRSRVVRLIEGNRKRIEVLEGKMINQLHRITASGINNLVLAKRMISALELRLSDIDAALEVPDTETVGNVESILARDLTLSDDAVSSVVGAKAIAPIRFAMVESTLNDLIGKIAARREISGFAA